MTLFFECDLCGEIIEQLEDETVDDFNVRVFDTHVVHHMSIEIEHSVDWCLKNPEMAIFLLLNLRG